LSSDTWRAEPLDVLVVGGELPVRHSRADLLRLSGFSVIATGDGEAARALLRGHRVGVLVLDVDASRLDGAAILMELEDRPPVILVGSNNSRPHSPRAVSERVLLDAHKPIEPQYLIDEVARELSRRSH